MSRILTPRYRVEYLMGPGSPCALTPAAWNTMHGRPTPTNLTRHLRALVASFGPGGANRHVVDQFGSPRLTGARLVFNAGPFEGRLVCEVAC